jgi:glycosyltransferase involved in cell wall biosynthesis
MRFVIATSSWLKGAAVPSRFKALGDELVGRGHQVILLLDGRVRELEDPTGNPMVLTWPSERPIKIKDALFAWRLFSSYKPDCVIANFTSVDFLTIAGWLTAVGVRVAWYHTLYEAIRIESRERRWQLRRRTFQRRLVYRMVTHLVPVTSAAKDDLCKVFGVPAAKCTVLYNCLRDPSDGERSPANAAAGARIVCVGRFDPVKGQDVLIKAAQLLKRDFPNLTIHFIGDGALKRKCHELAQALGVEDVCVFPGKRLHEEVMRFMKSADLSVVPSRIDNCPMTVIESLACGKPVVASRVGGIPELLDDGVEGFLVPPEDPALLAERLHKLLSSPGLRATLAANARRRFLARYELDRAVAREADWFEHLVGPQRCL